MALDGKRTNTDSQEIVDYLRFWSQDKAMTHDSPTLCRCMGAAADTIESLQAEVKRFAGVIAAKDQLLTAYRLGDNRLAEKALKALEKRGWSA